MVRSLQISLRESLAKFTEMFYPLTLMIQITVTRDSHDAEAATAASVSPCLQSFDPKPGPGAALALAERCAR
jgi:hypothetical protein